MWRWKDIWSERQSRGDDDDDATDDDGGGGGRGEETLLNVFSARLCCIVSFDPDKNPSLHLETCVKKRKSPRAIQ